MKRILAILMTLMLVIGLCACGNETANETNNTNTNVENTEQGETVSFFEENGALVWKTPYNGVYNLTETPTQKTEYFEAVITKVETDETDGIHDENGGSIACIDNVQITYTVKNISTVPIRLNTNSCKINGYVMLISYSGYVVKPAYSTGDIIIQPEETVELVTKFSSDLLAGSDNEYILDGAITISVEEVLTERKPDDYVKYAETCDLTFKTDSTGENKYYTDGEVAYNQDGLKITVQYTGWISTNNEKFYNVMPVKLYIENNTNETKFVGYDSIVFDADTELTLVENGIVAVDEYNDESRFKDVVSISPNSKAVHLVIISSSRARLAVSKITNLENVIVKPAIFEIDKNNKDEYGNNLYTKTVLDEVTLSTKR